MPDSQRATPLRMYAFVAAAVLLAAVLAYCAFERPTPSAKKAGNAAAKGLGRPAQSVTNQLVFSRPIPTRQPLAEKTAPIDEWPPSEKARLAQQFRDALTCHNAAAQIETLRRSIEGCTALEGHPFDAEATKACAESVRRSTARIEDTQSRNAQCDANPASLETTYADALSNAAEAGDPDARICFIRGNFKFNGASDDTKEAADRFVEQATRHVREAFAAGDWRVVALLGLRSTYLIRNAGWLTYLPIGDDLEVYRMNRLLRLGASGSYAQSLDDALAVPAASLTPAQIENANAWAKTSFDLYFKKSPVLTAEPDICAAG